MTEGSAELVFVQALSSALFEQNRRFLPDGRKASILLLTFGRARIVVGTEAERAEDGW